MPAYTELMSAYARARRQTRSNKALVFCWQGSVPVNLLLLSAELYTEVPCYWLVFTAKSEIIPDGTAALQSTYPHLKNLDLSPQPAGVGIFRLSSRLQLWLIDQDEATFWPDFSYPAASCCFLNYKAGVFMPEARKPWFLPPEVLPPPARVIIVGAGIAGAASAYFLAEQGLKVLVVEQEKAPALQASGNYQGMLYAQVSAFNTAQSRLLCRAYMPAVSFLRQLDPDGAFYNPGGVLHLDHNPAAIKRNLALARKYNPLWRYEEAAAASRLAGIRVASGLFWQYGGWVCPPLLVRHLLNHPNISLHTNFTVHGINYQDDLWAVTAAGGERLTAPILVLAAGADTQDLYGALGLRLTKIGGQTTVVRATAFSSQLTAVINGAAYIAPEFNGRHCLGATFSFKNLTGYCTVEEEQSNLASLKKVSPELYQSFLHCGKFTGTAGHHAVRADSFDHLPLVGNIGKIDFMHGAYAALAQDKNYRLSAPCQYWPGLYINTAHGSRGLLTAPLAAAALTAAILDLPNPLGRSLQQALAPNRLIINDLIKRKFL